MKTKMRMKKVSLGSVPDSVLAGMIRNSCYARGTSFGNGKADSKWLLVLAVPYGNGENVSSLQEAFEAFRDMLNAADWFERQIQVLRAEKGTAQTAEVSYEQLEAE
jgi:hypothetical protein